MTPNELLMYTECILSLSKEREKINWLDYHNQKKVLDNESYFTHYSVVFDSTNSEPNVRHIIGKKRLGEEKFLFSIKRYSDKTHIKVYLFY